MNTTLERLLSLRVADFMSRDVVTVSANSTMTEAAGVLMQHEISGVPVVNEMGQCVGILSTTDFAISACSKNASENPSNPPGEFSLVRAEGKGTFHIEQVAEDLVVKHMSSALQTLGSEKLLIDAARYMQAEHIHRLIVVDEHARPVGVVSTLDIVGALADSVDVSASSVSPNAMSPKT